LGAFINDRYKYRTKLKNELPVRVPGGEVAVQVPGGEEVAVVGVEVEGGV